MTTTDQITDKIQEVTAEMKQTGLWRKKPPSWVTEYGGANFFSENDFCNWLQFVYLPNLLPVAGNRNHALQKNNIVPQVIKFFGEDVKKGKLLHILIELDALS